MTFFSQATDWQQVWCSCLLAIHLYLSNAVQVMAMEHLKQGRGQTAAACFEHAKLCDFASKLQAALTLTLAGKLEPASGVLSELLTDSNSHEVLRLVLGLNKKLRLGINLLDATTAQYRCPLQW